MLKIIILCLCLFTSLAQAQELKTFKDGETGNLWSVKLPSTWEIEKTLAQPDSAIFIIKPKGQKADATTFLQFFCKRIKLSPMPSEFKEREIFTEEDEYQEYIRTKVFLDESAQNKTWLEYDREWQMKNDFKTIRFNIEYQKTDKSPLIRSHTYILFKGLKCYEIRFESDDDSWANMVGMYEEAFKSLELK